MARVWSMVWGWALVGVLCGMAVAGEPESARLTLEEAVALALERNYEVLIAAERSRRLAGATQEVRAQVYPQLGLQAGYRRSYDESLLDSDFAQFVNPEPTDNYSIKTTVDQLLFSWGKVSKAVEVAEEARRRAQLDTASTAREVKLRVHEAFYGLLLAKRLVEVAEETLQQRERHLDVARKRFEAGVVNELEVIRAQVDVANAKPPLIRARNNVRQAEATLNNLLARDQTTPVEAQGDLHYAPLPDLSLSQVVERALAQRPELASLQVSRRIASLGLDIARAEDKPSVSFRGEYGYATENFDDLNANRENWLAAVSLTVPLFDGWRTRGLVAQNASDLRSSRIAMAQLREGITLNAKQTLDGLRESEEIMQASSLNIDQAQKSLDLAETSYRYGVSTALDVSDAQLALTRAKTNHTQALHDYMVARARVLAIMNEL